MIFKIKDNDGIECEITDINKFAKHIFQFHSFGILLYQENGCNFTIDDAFRKKDAKSIKQENI